MKKNIIKTLRLDEEQWKIIATNLENSNMDFSKFVISKILTPTKKTSKKEARAKANKELVIELARWGNNLNQVAKRLNANKSVDRVALEMLSHINENLKAIRKTYAC